MRRSGLERVFWGLFGLLLLGACMEPTTYQRAADGEGYADQQIADGRYRVSAAGNSVTPRETVENYLLYRAAEITLASGHDYFVMVQHDVERNVTYVAFADYQPSGLFYGPYYGYGFGMFYDPLDYGYSEVTSREIERYRAYATIAVYSGARPADDPNAYDARDVMSRLSGHILRPAADTKG